MAWWSMFSLCLQVWCVILFDYVLSYLSTTTKTLDVLYCLSSVCTLCMLLYAALQSKFVLRRYRHYVNKKKNIFYIIFLCFNIFSCSSFAFISFIHIRFPAPSLITSQFLTSLFAKIALIKLNDSLCAEP